MHAIYKHKEEESLLVPKVAARLSGAAGCAHAWRGLEGRISGIRTTKEEARWEKVDDDLSQVSRRSYERQKANI